MTGPDDVRRREKSLDEKGTGHVGFGLRPSHDPVETFLEDQVGESRDGRSSGLGFKHLLPIC